MSKKYFTKLLAVEGEIKEGERGISINNATYTHYDYLGKDYGKPARLFLCSRDIQPEDYVNENIQIHVYHDGSYPPFKAMGEVSPEATWVKERDEFDEDEIALKCYCGHTDRCNCGPTEGKPMIYKIKGPCGHFH